MIRTVFVGLFLALFFLFSLPCCAVLFLTRHVFPMQTQHISQKIVCGALNIILMLTGSDITVLGLENIPTDKPVLFIGNHTGYFDIVSTYPVLPAGVGFVAKKELDRFALLRWWLRLLHGLTFDRNDPRSGMKMILTAIDEVKNGYSMFIYPEGTRSKTGEVGEFKAGSFKVATRTNCP
ncbi:MAG: 1-acyl-sn-glycerol-3-phosphate acyltransferase, partial [Lachnospiraceae bacterium]|nr:1-acyl-sn-glycerol-3-phosphate acyltransferase [Lachnospiraceae bacterium]